MFSFLNAGIVSKLQIDLETGIINSGYNDARIPGDSGTKFSLSEELKTDDDFYYRVRLNYRLSEKSTISVLYAPLQLEAKGKLDKEVIFRNKTFAANTPLTADYKFNSYRLTYRYRFFNKEKWQLGFGITGKIRDANIGLKDANQSSSKDNVGFVPLINFRFAYSFNPKFGFLFMGDALAAPQGRAEDVLTAFTYNMNNNITAKLGYRLLEGGADNDEVYTFSCFNYLSLGLVWKF